MKEFVVLIIALAALLLGVVEPLVTGFRNPEPQRVMDVYVD